MAHRPLAKGVLVLLLGASLAACGGGAGSSGAPGGETGPLRVSGGGVAQFRAAGRDNSIERYGHEASRPELEQAATVVHTYLVARANRDWGKACAVVSKDLIRRMRGILEFANRTVPQRCDKLMEVLARGEPAVASSRYAASEVDGGSLRIKDGTGFLFFNARTSGRKLIMVRESGGWRPAGLLPTSLH